MARVARFVVEADGGSRGNPGPAGYGAVVLDPVTGEALAEAAEYIGIATNNVAEYKGLIAGLKAAKALDADASVRVRMDSKLVVEQMSGRWKIKHPDMKPLAAEAGRIFPAGQVSYEWIPREKNKHADRLANEAMDAGRKGKQWEPSSSTAALDAGAARSAARASGASGGASAGASGASGASRTPGDAAAGAAKARAALSGGRGREADGGTGSGGTGRGQGRPAGTPASGARGTSGASGTSAGAGAGAGYAEPGAPGAPGETAATGGDLMTVAETAAAAPAEAAPGARRPGTPAEAPGAKATPTVGWGASADLGTPATFVLLRHGETALTPEKRFSGSGGSDPELSAVGRRQAEAVAAALAARGTVQAIVTSPLRRCRETAGAVAARLGLDVTVEEGLRETDFGAWEGLTFAEVRERHPDDLSAWLASPTVAPTGGGESFTAVGRRVRAARDRLLERYQGRTVLLVTHVTPVKTLVRLALGAPPESLFRMELSAASLSAVAYYADGNASVRLLNDTSHLRH
ncbi:bifunctional RNase H/acid phosphatase [Streptomyces sp. GMY02]|uniref:bifunctional RNase H/acid phosphatase n=1 Tax=Streptomyces sp. GMY02 TaxID=1333528 RepID=UPI001C2CAAB3|nr:bifunctional RNase H/acid phosphatase [Streptomyces sp. GMY02]QXE37088.1 bifunctional RNase H/acid phosphatase [Streptomyces sp. GMY02]